ncbi:MAG: VOC family protein [Sphaerobacter sp.]|nr:VOC family protein [Sphaerobacter sp.]
MATIQPILYVPDVDASLAHYRDVLGFTVDLVVPDGAGRTVHAEVSRHGVTVMFAPAEGLSPAARSFLGAGVELYITDEDEDIDAYFASVRAAGARIVAEPVDQEWGHRTFTISDPDGYRLTFAQAVRATEPSGQPR